MYQFQSIKCWFEPHVSKIVGVPKNTDKLTTVKFLLLLSIYTKRHIPLLFGSKTEFFPFQNNSRNLDPSYKTDLEFTHSFVRYENLTYGQFINLPI